MDKPSLTLGQQATDLLDKSPEPVDVRELEEATEKEFIQELEKILSTHGSYADRYFIQIMLLQENLHRRWLPNIFTRKMFVRKSEPLPDYDTSLYSYHNPSGTLLFHWSVPSAETCWALNKFENELDKDGELLLAHIRKFAPNKIDAVANAA